MGRLLLLVFALSLPTFVSVQERPSYPEKCVTHVDNSTLVLPRDADLALPNGEQLAVGDTVAAMDEGTCVGHSVWPDSNNMALAMAGPPNPNISSNSGGYSIGDTLEFEVYDVSADSVVEIGSKAEYADCSGVGIPPCQDDGLYESNTFYVAKTLNGGTSLPVELVAFSSTRDGKRVLLEWTTASERGNAGFEVQHRLAGGTWRKLQFIDGAGTTTASSEYSYRTGSLEPGTHHFRLRQVDKDGSSTLSEEISLELTLERAYRIAEVAPNPVRRRASFSITVQKTQHVRVRVYNVLGQEVLTLYDQTLGANQSQYIQIDSEGLTSGMYFLRVEGEEFSADQRMTVVQ
jgi:hypothetical protein